MKWKFVNLNFICYKEKRKFAILATGKRHRTWSYQKKKKRVNVSSLFLNYIKLRALDLSFNATQHFLNVQ